MKLNTSECFNTVTINKLLIPLLLQMLMILGNARNNIIYNYGNNNIITFENNTPIATMMRLAQEMYVFIIIIKN